MPDKAVCPTCGKAAPMTARGNIGPHNYKRKPCDGAGARAYSPIMGGRFRG